MDNAEAQNIGLAVGSLVASVILFCALGWLFARRRGVAIAGNSATYKASEMKSSRGINMGISTGNPQYRVSPVIQQSIDALQRPETLRI